MRHLSGGPRQGVEEGHHVALLARDNGDPERLLCAVVLVLLPRLHVQQPHCRRPLAQQCAGRCTGDLAHCGVGGGQQPGVVVGHHLPAGARNGVVVLEQAQRLGALLDGRIVALPLAGEVRRGSVAGVRQVVQHLRRPQCSARRAHQLLQVGPRRVVARPVVRALVVVGEEVLVVPRQPRPRQALLHCLEVLRERGVADGDLHVGVGVDVLEEELVLRHHLAGDLDVLILEVVTERNEQVVVLEGLCLPSVLVHKHASSLCDVLVCYRHSDWSLKVECRAHVPIWPTCVGDVVELVR
mmetsp:Transcript_19535/g.74978  ORF Transcript_19535/g.74978 Transcript_19535/m.74978 type:complete len:297 (-) Transcript_19535:795-1685(-)